MIAESDVTKFVLANGNNGQTKLVYKNKEEILTEVLINYGIMNCIHWG